MASKLIREVEHPDGHPSLCSIRTDSYAHTFSHFVRLVGAASLDFPELCGDDIEIVTYGGDRIRRICGIEFRVPRSAVPATYTAVRQLERHLSEPERVQP